MCGRFSMSIDSDDLQTALALGQMPDDWKRRYNIAPSQPVAAARDAESKQVEWLQWGLVPFWAKDPTIGSRLINARSETAFEKPSFKYAFRKRRCLILADGFYEWQKQGSRKRPYHIRVKGQEYFAMAGIYDTWSKEGKDLVTFSILTTAANEVISPIHDRMPVILRPERESEWASQEVLSADVLAELFEPLPSSSVDAYPVSDMVNDSRADHPDMIVPQRMQQATLF